MRPVDARKVSRRRTGVLPVEMAEHAAGAPTVLRAPGEEILTLVPKELRLCNRSSLAAANVSGIVALLRRAAT